MASIGLINYGSGNFTSVRNALLHLEIDFCEIDSADRIREVQSLILPGVGAFPHSMEQLRRLEFIEPLREHAIKKGNPFLGICVGMQILATKGFEFKECDGLNLIAGEVQKTDAADHGLSVPHIGWNQVSLTSDCVLFKELPESPSFYFVHSYQLRPESENVVAARCQYGSPIVAAVQQDNIFGVQFHPEKSQANGLKLLKNFCHLN